MATLLPFHLTDFVGREDDIVTLKQVITTRRLVTLVGPGGIGKTRLALRVASEVEEQFADGVYVIEFSSLSDSAQVLVHVATTFGIREQAGSPLLQTLIEALQSRQVLFVFDNCEHVITACADLALSLVQHCPQLRLLATSREGLRLTGEILWRVTSLSYPPLTSLRSAEHLMRYDAVQLFCNCATIAVPDFRLTTKNMQAVARICHCLDGIPLALELAAARMYMFSVDQLAARLSERFRVLTNGNRTAAPRHQTLQATFDWSYALLSEAEQKVLQRLSVFGGSWTLEAVEEVCTDETIDSYEVLDILTQLVQKSWVNAEENKEGRAVRYRLLETIQQYARQYLQGMEDFQHLYVRHWTWYLQFIEEATLHLHGDEQGQWLHLIECEIDNLCLALERSFAAQQIEITVRIAAALGPFWVIRSRLSQGRYWYELLLALPDLAASLRVVVLQQMVEILRFQGEYIGMHALLEERMALLRTLDAPTDLAELCCSFGWAAFYQGKSEEAIKYCSEGLSLFRAAEDQQGIAKCLSGLALVATSQEEYPQARVLLQEVVSIRRALHDHAELAYALNAQARVAMYQGEITLACEACQEALTLVSTLKQPFGTAYSLEVIAGLAGSCGETVSAVQLFGAAHALRKEVGIPIPPAFRELHERTLLPLRVQLGEKSFTELWEHGQSFSHDQIYEEAARAIERVRTASATTPDLLAGLSPRELDVLRLVGGGLTDAQVAKKLVLSTRTVSTHLQTIYRKLGVTSRNAAVRFAIDQHLL